MIFLDSVRKAIARSDKWEGFGCYFWVNLSLKNKDKIYTASYVIDERAEKHETAYCLGITRSEKILATIECSPKREIIANLLQ